MCSFNLVLYTCARQDLNLDLVLSVRFQASWLRKVCGWVVRFDLIHWLYFLLSLYVKIVMLNQFFQIIALWHHHDGIAYIRYIPQSSVLHSQPKSTVGTPAYIAPEVLLRQEYDGKVRFFYITSCYRQCGVWRLHLMDAWILLTTNIWT